MFTLSKSKKDKTTKVKDAGGDASSPPSSPVLASSVAGTSTLARTQRGQIATSTIALWDAARTDDLEHIQELIARGVGIAARDQDGGTVLHHAAECGSMRVLHYLVSLRKAEFLNFTDSFGTTALYRACSAGRYDAALFLVQSGADPSIKTPSGSDAFKRAAQILGSEKAADLEHVWETEGKAVLNRDQPEPITEKGTKTVFGERVLYLPADRKSGPGSPMLASTMTKSEAKSLFQDDMKRTSRDIQDEARRREQEIYEKEIEAFEAGQGKAYRKQLALALGGTSADTDLQKSPRAAADDDSYLPPPPPAPLKPVSVSKDNFFDLDELSETLCDYVYAVVSVIAAGNAESAAPLYPRLHDTLKAVAEHVRQIFTVLQTFVQPFMLSQRNKIIATAKGLQNGLKYTLDGVKEVQTKYDRESVKKLINTTQILVSDVTNFYLACEHIWPEAITEQLALSHANVEQLQAWFEPNERGQFNDTHVADEVHKLHSWVLADVVRLTALCTSSAYLKRDNELQIQLSDALFFVARAIRGTGIISDRLLQSPGNEELREKLATLQRAVAEQLHKIEEVSAIGDRNAPMPIFSEQEILDYQNRYQLAYKELQDGLTRFTEEFNRYAAEREQLQQTSPDGSAEPPPDFALSERKESVALLKVCLSNIGVIKEIFSRASSTELMKTVRSLTQSASKFASNTYRIAVECEEPLLRELLMVSLQATLLLGVALKVIVAGKSLGFPLFLVEPSMLASVRALSTVLVYCIDGTVQWAELKRASMGALGREVSDDELALHKLKILSYGRFLAEPLPRTVPQLQVKPIELTPVQPDPVAAATGGGGGGTAGLNMASPTVKLPISPIATAAPAAAKGRPVARPAEPAVAAPAASSSAAPSSAAPSRPRTDAKGRLLPSMSAESAGGLESLGPPPSVNDVEAYKKFMVQRYLLQQRENAEILRKKRGAEAAKQQ